MVKEGTAIERAIEALRESYRGASDDPRLDQIVRRFHIASTDDLCDLVEADASLRAQEQRRADLERYLEQLPGIERTPEVLDTAIDVVVRALEHLGADAKDAADHLMRSHPALADSIVEALSLREALELTRLVGAESGAAQTPAPAALGPPLEDGVGRYEILGVLGEGTQSVVYEARDRLLSDRGRPASVAIKVMRRRDLFASALGEARRARRIDSPHVVRTLDFGTTPDGAPYVVHEAAPGGTLLELVRSGGALTPADGAALLERIARGLHDAHQVGVLHGDLNPGNVIIDDAGVPRIADFGASTVLDTGGRARAPDAPAFAAALGFTAPECADNRSGGTVASDVYALGGLLLYALSAACPNGETRTEAEAWLARRSPGSPAPGLARVAPGVDASLRAVCERALAVDPAARHESAWRFADELRRWRARLPIESQRPSALRRASLLVRRRPRLTGAVVVGCAAIVASLAVGGYAFGVMRSREQVAAGYLTTIERNIETLRNENKLMGLHTVLWALDIVEGAGALRMSLAEASVGELRISSIERMLEVSEESRGRSDPRTLMWETVLAHMMLSDSADHARVEAILERNAADTGAAMPGAVRWREEIEALRACAAVKRAHFDARSKDGPAPDLDRVERAAARLRAFVDSLEPEVAGGPVHQLALRGLRGAYQSRLLDRPEEAAAARAALEALQREDEAGPTETADAS